MRIAIAALAAVPSSPARAASRLPGEDADGGGSLFASQLRAASATGSAPATAGDARSAASTTDQQTWAQPQTLPQPLPQALPQTLPQSTTLALPVTLPTALALPHSLPKFTATGPQPIVTSKKLTLSQGSAQKTAQAQTDSTESILTAPTPPASDQAPELTATTAAAADDAAIDADTELPAVKPAAAHKESSEESLEPAAPSVTAASGPTPQNQEMAFATRVQPVEHADRSALTAEMASSSAVASATKKVVPAAEDETPAPADAHAPLTPIIAASEHTVESNSTAAPAAPAAAPSVATAHRTEAPAPAAETQTTGAAAPLKNISLQVNQPGSERIDVHVVQQGGEVHVSVHSGDAMLTSGLRQGLSELQSRLEETGYRSEVWRPGAATAPIAATAQGEAPTNSSRQGDQHSQQQQQGGSSQQESGRRNQNQSNQPRWVEEMESSLGNGQKSSGGFYGFSS